MTDLDFWHGLQAIIDLALVASRRALRISFVDGVTGEFGAEVLLAAIPSMPDRDLPRTSGLVPTAVKWLLLSAFGISYYSAARGNGTRDYLFLKQAKNLER